LAEESESTEQEIGTKRPRIARHPEEAKIPQDIIGASFTAKSGLPSLAVKGVPREIVCPFAVQYKLNQLGSASEWPQLIKAFCKASMTGMASAEKDARIDFRISSQLKATIEEAAALRGQSLSEFAVSTLAENAHRVIEQCHVTELSNQDRDIFLAVVDGAAARPNSALADAAKQYKAWARRTEK
jgi:uncharacterized protein (DUF1778 family)